MHFLKHLPMGFGVLWALFWLYDLWSILDKMTVSVPSDLFWLLKRELELSTSNQMSPLWSLYEHPFYKNHIYPQVITYNACPQAPGGFCWPRSFCGLIFEPFFTNGCLNFLLDVFVGKSVWRGLVAFRPLLTLYKGIRTFEFSIKWAPSKAYAAIFFIRSASGKKIINNKTLEPYGLYHRQRHRVASDHWKSK